MHSLHHMAQNSGMVKKEQTGIQIRKDVIAEEN